MRRLNWFIVVATFAASSIYAQDISGDWQGSLKAGPQDLRIILKITRTDSREWKATMLSIDQSPDRGTGMVTTSFSMDASTIKFAIGQVQGTYEGKLSADGASITGTWTHGRSLPLDFHRTTKETTWLDPSPHRVQFIPVEKSVSLEVLDWGEPGVHLCY